ncbi:hypothetical protein Bbelb_043580 [Branchiostoma belcheri]|nr:hypothetical protein Bbelb_043580 [Branchiostoma belcheri]
MGGVKLRSNNLERWIQYHKECLDEDFESKKGTAITWKTTPGTRSHSILPTTRKQSATTNTSVPLDVINADNMNDIDVPLKSQEHNDMRALNDNGKQQHSGNSGKAPVDDNNTVDTSNSAEIRISPIPYSEMWI